MQLNCKNTRHIRGQIAQAMKKTHNITHKSVKKFA